MLQSIFGKPVIINAGFPYGEWTKEQPKKGGWYWAKQSRLSSPEIVMVITELETGKLVCLGIPWNGSHLDLQDIELWIGPLQEPELPEKS